MHVELTPAEIAAALAGLPQWRLEQNKLVRTWRFSSFQTAIAFMHDCVPDIDRLDHHPEWSNVYDRVTVHLTTHDAGNHVTAIDVTLARLLDAQAVHHQALS